MTLQAITLAQPWPQLMLLDENPKRIENREWAPRDLAGRYLALHGGRLPKAPKDFREVRAALDWVNDHVWESEGDPEEWLSDEDVLGLCVSGIYAVARVAEVVTSSESPWFVGTFGWVLDEFTPIEPVPCKGKQGLWTVEGDLLATVRRRWKAARTAKPAPVDKVTPAVPEPRPLPATCCATCAHGHPDAYGMVECDLGWEAHDGLATQLPGKGSRWEPAQMGHPGVPLPLLAPQTRCMVPQGAWAPRRAG